MYGFVDTGSTLRLTSLYTAFTEEIDSDYFFVGEQHNFWELVIAVRGCVGITAGEEAFLLTQGHGVLHSPMEFHRVWYSGTEPGEILVFSFGAQGMPAGRRFTLSDLQLPRMLLEEMRSLFGFDGINIISTPGPELRRQVLLKRLELFLLELLSRAQQQEALPTSRSAINYARLVRFMEENVRRNLTVDEIAQGCSMSPINAKQTFSRYAGMGIRNYFNRLKVQSAIVMLEGGSSVQEASTALGFSSQNYFSVVFKRETGMLPSEFKKNDL